MPPPKLTPVAAPAGIGVRIAGSGVAVPERLLTNADLEARMDTNHDWISPPAP